jgi:hypothetical protein
MTFWELGSLSQADRLRWYAELGGVDLSIPQLPKTEAEIQGDTTEFIAGEEHEDDRVPEHTPEGGDIELRAFQGIAENNNQPNQNDLTIQSVYSAELTRTAHRLHDQMVLLIAQACQAKGATVFDDPNSVDLLIQYRQREFIVEVKSVTPRNFISRLRYALGQILHYDFLRAAQSQLPRRKVIAIAAHIPQDSWSVQLLNNHLDMDMLSLESGRLCIHTRSDNALQLFG